MISLQKINLEYKSTALFGFIALILSFVIGFLTGIRWNIVLLRSIMLMIVFAAIGYGACVILRKFVPEVYEFMVSIASLTGTGGESVESNVETAHDAVHDVAAESENREPAPVDEQNAAPAVEDFKELDKEGLAHFSTASGGGSAVNTGAGKLGKHILQTEKLTKYEPKIMAQAVRTMMSKDKE
jgi:hypothetical protein